MTCSGKTAITCPPRRSGFRAPVRAIFFYIFFQSRPRRITVGAGTPQRNRDKITVDINQLNVTAVLFQGWLDLPLDDFLDFLDFLQGGHPRFCFLRPFWAVRGALPPFLQELAQAAFALAASAAGLGEVGDFFNRGQVRFP
jgi:hypothetical protein